MAEYYGRYADFQTSSKKDAAVLLGADNSVGDAYTLQVIEGEDGPRAWLVNAFGGKIGFLDAKDTHQIRTLQAEGLECHALLSFVAFTDHPGEGHYWGQVALICYKKKNARIWERFQDSIAADLANGTRTQVDLGAEAVRRVIDSDGEWKPSKSVPMPTKEKGMAVLKQRRRVTERLVAQGRKGNKGCYIVSWAFLLIAVALIIFGLHSCGVI